MKVVEIKALSMSSDTVFGAMAAKEQDCVDKACNDVKHVHSVNSSGRSRLV